MKESLNCLTPEVPADIQTAQLQLHACKEEIESIRPGEAPGLEAETAKRLESIRSLLPTLGQLAQKKISVIEKGKGWHKWEKIGAIIGGVLTAIDEVAPLFSKPGSSYAVETIEEAEVLDSEMRASRKEAYERLARVIEGLRETPLHHLDRTFDHYFEGDVNVLNGCRTPDVLMSGDAARGGEIWQKSQSGEYNCGQILERYARLGDVVAFYE